ncbi:MAG: NUDIX domain-containing protein [Limnochordaceae bacterium]|nr:NUDIX domain-containing protein [Limnochordaceae bacterium]
MVTISFDLDGVLMRNPFRDGIFPQVTRALAPAFGGSEAMAMEALTEEYRRRLAASREAAASGPPAGSLAAWAYDWTDIIAAVAGRHGVPGVPEEPVEATVERLARAGTAISFMHATVPAALAALRRDGYQLMVTTNGLWAYQRPVLEALGILDAFQRFCAPDLTGWAKPDARAFTWVEGGQSRRPSVHVGDDLLYDVAAARAAGIRAVWVIPPRLSRLELLARRPPWERPEVLDGMPEWHAEVAAIADRRPAADRWLVPYALPDAAVLHVGEVPEVLARWESEGTSEEKTGQRAGAAGRRAARWKENTLPIPELGEALVRWFEGAKRALPWRDRPDPYRVMVSEFMLQQTQVQTVVPYFERFVQRFPTLQALAEAPLESVLEVWQGLGYYRRARYLHQAARTIVQQYGGRVPDDPLVLETLPGIGPYMARAIASIAYGRPEPAIDTNASRVLSRVLMVWDPPGPGSMRRLGAWAKGMVPEGRAADFTQGLMELGSRICRPAPECGPCPIRRFCAAWAYRLQEELPAKRRGPAPSPVVRVAAVAAFDSAGRLLLVERPPDGLLGGLWALPAVELQPGEEWEAGARRAMQQAGLEGALGTAVAEGRHVFSHRIWEMRAFRVQARGRGLSPRNGGAARAADERPNYAPVATRWVGPGELERVPMGQAFRRLVRALVPAGRTAQEQVAP